MRKIMQRKKLADLDQLFQKYNQIESPGIALMIIEDQQIIFRKGYGLSNLNEKTSILANSNFNLASLSKSFTALAIAVLENENRIKATDSLNEYFSEISEKYSHIKIAHLIHHLSGLPNYAKRHWEQQKVITNEQIVAYLKNDELNFVPGEQFEYNDTGYILLAAVIEKITAMSYADFLTKTLFTPMGMENTVVYGQNNIDVAERVLGYTEWPFFELNDVRSYDLVYGDGAIYSSLNDLYHFIVAIENSKFLSSKTKNKLFSSGLKNDGEPIPYGYGWCIGSLKKLTTLHHSGEWIGFRNHIVNFPEKNLWIVALANSSGTRADEIAIRVAEELLF